VTPQQKRAWYSLMLLTGFILTWVILFVFFVEWLLAFVVLVGVLSVGYWVVRYLTRPKSDHPEVEEDERDKMILNKVPKYQNIAVMLTLAAWGSVLLLHYDYNGEVSTKLAIWMLLTTGAVNYLSIPLCRLIAYWRTK
jgi:hypothetical protein